MIKDNLSFSFGHVIAFVGVLFIGYITFMSLVYFTGADFTFVCIGVCIVMLLLFYLVIRIQKLKAVRNDFKKNIVKERILVVFFCFSCLAIYRPFSKFWAVQNNSQEVEQCFKACISDAKDLFSQYDNYTSIRQSRIDSLAENGYGIASVIVSSSEERTIAIKECKNSMTLQLQPKSYQVFRKNSLAWIDHADNGVSVWNVFLFGNIRILRSALYEWHNNLVGLTKHRMRCEDDDITDFDADRRIINNIENDLLALENSFKVEGFQPYSLLCIIGYIMLIIPYLIQYRYPKSTYTLFGRSESYIKRLENQPELESLNNKGREQVVVTMPELPTEHKQNVVVELPDEKKGNNPQSRVVVDKNPSDNKNEKGGVVINVDIDEID